MRCYTLRHTLTIHAAYDVFAGSEEEALKIAYDRYAYDEEPDDEAIVEDAWDVIDVENEEGDEK